MLNLLSASYPLDDVVGWRAGLPIHRDALLASVHAWHTMLASTSGQKFALYFTDSLQFAAAMFGAWQAGKTIVLPADTLPATCAALRLSVDGYLGEFPSEWSPLMPAVVAVDAEVAPYSFQTLDPDFIGLVVHTSGSTGAAQAIPKRLSQLATEIATLEALFGERVQRADIVATVSHQHIYGLLFKVLWPLTSGRTIHAFSLAYPEELAAVLAQRDCVLVSSPAHLKRLSDTTIWHLAAEKVRAVFSSGGPLSLEAARATAHLLQQMPVEIFGSSETGGIAYRQRGPLPDESWTTMPGVSWRIAPEDGVMQVCSAHLPDTNWFALSDRAVAAGADRFLLQGRIDRIVKIEEKRISLDTIEQQLMASPLVQEARVLVLDSPESGLMQQRQRIAAFVVLSAAGRDRLAELGKLALNRILRDGLSVAVEAVALPRSWRYLDAMPLNAQGKTTHAALVASMALMALPDERQGTVIRPRLPHLRVLQKDAQRVLFELIVPADLFYFEGHFPDIPILAGVVQIDWVIAFARQHFDLPAVFRSIHALKFQRVIQPEVPVQLELLFDPQKASLTFNYRSSAGQHAGGRLQFGATHV